MSPVPHWPSLYIEQEEKGIRQKRNTKKCPFEFVYNSQILTFLFKTFFNIDGKLDNVKLLLLPDKLYFTVP